MTDAVPSSDHHHPLLVLTPCAAGGVPFFFKQWGAHRPTGQLTARWCSTTASWG